VLEKKVLLVKLTPDKKFEELISFDDLAKKLSVDKNELSVALSYPDYLLVDGLDECGDRANIADALIDWAKIHSITKIIVTTRIGYEPELFPGWENVEIQPLEKSDILNFSKKLLEDSLSNTETIEDQLTAFDKWLQNTKTSLLVARNPLLLGFLIQLFKIDVEIIQNRADLYKLIIEQFISRPVQDREPIKFGKREAQRILTISGWKLLNEPDISEEELLEKIIEELEFKGYTQQEAEKQAVSGIDFWENRRIFERSRERHQDTINFIHLTLCEYAAAKYVSDLDDQKICKWLEEVRQNIKWKEVILFAAGLGKVEIIVNHLLELNNTENTTSTDILVAANALKEVNNAPFELIKAVVNQLHIRLESSNPSVVLEAAKALLDLISQATDLIGNIAQNLSNHTQLWTRLAAIRLGLQCGDQYVDLSILKEVIDECIAEPARIYSPFTPQKLKYYGKYGREFQKQVLLQGFQLLLKKQPNLETAKHIKEVISSKKLSSGIIMDLSTILHNHISEELKKNDQKEDRKEWTIFLIKSMNLNNIFNEIHPQKLLQTLKEEERIKYADKSFLEAVLRVTDNNLRVSISLQQAQKLIGLGILLKGMDWWNFPIPDWYVLSKNNDLEAVDAVIKGTIISLNIEHQKIAMEAKIALEQIQFYKDLDIIESALERKKIKSENSSQIFDWAWDKILEISNQNYISLFSKIPAVPADPKWELAREIDISPEHLVRALKHPSQVIYQNATLLLMNGVGGSEAINLIEKLLKENKNNEQVVEAVSNIAPHLLEDE
ncbi:MAG: NACHT domain-containing protein, partial [Dolichospermum sp.]